MKLQAIWYQPEAEVEFTWTEVMSLVLYSESHYDHKCRELGEPGGVLCGMVNRFDLPIILGTENDAAIRKISKITYRLDASTADLLAKCAEKDPSLLNRLMPIVKKLNSEWRKVNRETLKRVR